MEALLLYCAHGTRVLYANIAFNPTPDICSGVHGQCHAMQCTREARKASKSKRYLGPTKTLCQFTRDEYTTTKCEKVGERQKNTQAPEKAK